MSSRNPFARYRLNVEGIMQRYNWSGIATGTEPRPGTGSSGNPGDRNSVATQIGHWDMRNKALKEFLLLSLPADWNGKFSEVSGGGYELWQAISQECEKENVKVNTELLASLYNASQGVREPLNDYVTRLRAIIQELKETEHEVSETTSVMCFFNGLNANDKPEDVAILQEQDLTLEQAVSLIVDFAVFRPKATQTVSASVQSSTSLLVETQPRTQVQNETSEEKTNDSRAIITTSSQSKATSSGSTETKNSTLLTRAQVADNKVASQSHPKNPTPPSSSTTVNTKSSAHQTAFELTTLHRGLKNAFGEHNCFLNVTIQALWHLGPFRTHLTSFIQEHSSQKGHHVPAGGLLEALCNLFVEYEFTNQTVLPATQLRDSLAALSDDFKLGEIADANEALDVILQRIHTEQCQVCPHQQKCLSHAVFGGCIMEQSTCQRCSATSEPSLRSDFILCFQAAELLLEAKALFAKFSHHVHADEERPSSSSTHLHLPHVPNLSRFLGCARRKPPLHTQEVHSTPDAIKHVTSEDTSSHHYANTEFGHILSKCMQLNQRSCPSRGAFTTQHGGKVDSLTGPVAVAVPYECAGRATVHQYSLDPPLAVALSIGWMQERETAATLRDFYDIIAPLIKLSDLFSVQATEPSSTGPPSHSTTNSTGAPSKGHPSASTSSGAHGATGHPTSGGKEGSHSHHAEQEFLYTSPPVSANNPAYVFRGLVCYYGAHYVSIFQGSEAGAYLLFDDYTVKSIGDWEAVKFKCVRSMYQPVLLLYELEKRSVHV